MNGRLAGKVSIVTGAGTGIGEAITHKFAREGAKVLAVGLNGDPIDEVVKAVNAAGGDCQGFIGDVSEPELAQAAVKAALQQYGRLDVLVNNAGVFLEVAECQDYSLEAFDTTLLSNTRAVFLMTKYALPHLQQSHGVVLATGSEAGAIGEPNNAPYGGTKGFVHAFIRGLAVEQGKYGVRANCVCPGPVDTAWTHTDTGPMDEQMEKMTVEATVLGRRGTPEEIANVYAFLASDEASNVTGALWFADGGTLVAKGPMGAMVPDELRRQPEPSLPLQHSHDGLGNKPTTNRLGTH